MIALKIALTVLQQTIVLDACLVLSLKTINVFQLVKMDHTVTMLKENVAHVMLYVHYVEQQIFAKSVWKDTTYGMVNALSVKPENHSSKENVLYVKYHALHAQDQIYVHLVLKDTISLIKNVKLTIQSVLRMLKAATLVLLITRNVLNVTQDSILNLMATVSNVLKAARIVRIH